MPNERSMLSTSAPPARPACRKIKIIASLIRHSIRLGAHPIPRFAEHGLKAGAISAFFQIEIRGRESIFDALIHAGQALDFDHAVRLVGAAFPPPAGGRWGELAAWVQDYEDHERPEVAGDTPTKSIPARRPATYQQTPPSCWLSPAGSRRTLSETEIVFGIRNLFLNPKSYSEYKR